jgi:flagellum-specific ATP synthase
VLSRELAAAGQYPPVDVLDSLRRLMPSVTTTEHRAQATLARRLLAEYRRSEDLLRIGAYKSGNDPEVDRAVKAMPELRRFMEQATMERGSLAAAIARFQRLVL